MSILTKRLIIFGGCAIISIAFFWMALVFSVEGVESFTESWYKVGWVFTGIFLFGIPAIIGIIFTFGWQISTDDKGIERDFEQMRQAAKNARVSLSRRIAPPETNEDSV